MSDRFHHLYLEPADFDASVAFYRDILGWAPTSGWGGEGESRGAILSGGGIKIVIAERGAGAPGSGTEAARFSVHLDIHDIDARFVEIAKGPHVVTPPEDTHWGTRWFVVCDPDGNRIAFEELHGRGG